MLIVQAVVFLSLFFTRGDSAIAKCDPPEVCQCSDPNDEVCEFTLIIETLQTFTRYLLNDDTGDSRGTAGSVWRINNGEWEPVNPKRNTLCGSTIRSDKCTQPYGVDGYTFRSFIAVNGRIPGPTLIVTEGQLVKVTVVNRLASESVSVHWHGMHQKNSNWMDGVEHVTQCGIPPGASFTYWFKAEPYGTHWYHSHSGAQRTDGLFGALIVREKTNKKGRVNPQDTLITKLKGEEITSELDIAITSYEDIKDKPEHTITLLDWQKSSSLDLFTQIHSSIRYFNIDNALELSGSGAGVPTSSDGAEIGPVPYWSGLINGRGRHFGVKYKNSELSDFKVDYGQTYRFRLIGAQSLYAYRFSIEDHKLIVIATDGEYINPSKVNTDSESTIKNTIVDYIIIHSGERYDFLLQTKKESDTKLMSKKYKGYIMRAVILNFTISSDYTKQGGSAEAILNYGSDTTKSSAYQEIAGSGKVEDKCTTTKCKALNCPFKIFPENFNIDCIHIHQLELLTDYSGDLPEVATTNKKSRLFFNFAFEGTRRTSTINARNLKLPSAALTQLNQSELTDIDKKEFCKDLGAEEKCRRDIRDEVISSECYCTHVVNAMAGRSYELVISATGPDYSDPQNSNFRFAHPVHLHGHYFHVVDIQFGQTNDNSGRLTAGTTDIDCGDQSKTDNPVLCNNPSWKEPRSTMYNHENTGKINPKAPLKDTVLIPTGGYAVVYFKTDNPGWWFLHCHIEVHQLEGMGVIINEGSDKTPPPGEMYKCGNLSLTKDQFQNAVKGSSGGTRAKTEKCPFKYCRAFYMLLAFFLVTLLGLIILYCCLVIKWCRNNCWNKVCGCICPCKKCQVDAEKPPDLGKAGK